MGATASTGFPSAWKGRNRHFFRASAAGRVRTGLPETIRTSATWPSEPMTTSRATFPTTFNCRAARGYSGAGFSRAARLASDSVTRSTGSAHAAQANSAIVIHLQYIVQLHQPGDRERRSDGAAGFGCYKRYRRETGKTIGGDSGFSAGRDTNAPVLRPGRSGLVQISGRLEVELRDDLDIALAFGAADLAE